jgi:mono/diheme cytochrome c family protein
MCGLAAALALVMGVGGAYGYSVMRSQQRQTLAASVTGGDPSKAAGHIQQFGCAGCHTIAGIIGASGLVGPPLQQLRDRVFVGGRPNSADNLIEWIVNPRSVNPHSPMPVTGISEQQARDVVAFLYAR